MQISYSRNLQPGDIGSSSKILVSGLVDSVTATSTSGSIVLNGTDTLSLSVVVRNGDIVSVNTPASLNTSDTSYNYLTIGSEDKLLHIVTTITQQTLSIHPAMYDKTIVDIRSYPSGFPFRPYNFKDAVILNGSKYSLINPATTAVTTTYPVLRTFNNEVLLLAADGKLRATISGFRPIACTTISSSHWIAFLGDHSINCYSQVGALLKKITITSPRALAPSGTTLFIASALGLITLNTSTYVTSTITSTKYVDIVINGSFIYCLTQTLDLVHKINTSTQEIVELPQSYKLTKLFVFNSITYGICPSTGSIRTVESGISTKVEGLPVSAGVSGGSLILGDILNRCVSYYDSTLTLTNRVETINAPLQIYDSNGAQIITDVVSNYPRGSIGLDQTPFPFLFISPNTVRLDQVYISNTITIDGLTGETPVSLPSKSSSKILKNGIDAGLRSTVINGDKLAIVSPAGALDTEVVTTLSVGTKSAEFILSKPYLNKRANAVQLTPQLQKAVGKSYTSNVVTVSGLDTSVVASTNYGSLLINGVKVGGSATVNNGDQLQVELTLGQLKSTGIIATVKIGTYETYFTVTSVPDVSSSVLPEYEYVGPYWIPPYTKTEWTVKPPDWDDEVPFVPQSYEVDIPISSLNNQLTIFTLNNEILTTLLTDTNTGKDYADYCSILIRADYANSVALYDPYNAIVSNTSIVRSKQEFKQKLAFEVIPESKIKINSTSFEAMSFQCLVLNNTQIFTSDQLTVEFNNGLLVNGTSIEGVDLNVVFTLTISGSNVFINGDHKIVIPEITSISNARFEGSSTFYVNEIIAESRSYDGSFTLPSTLYGSKANLAVITDYYNNKIHFVDITVGSIIISLDVEGNPINATYSGTSTAVAFYGSDKVKVYDESFSEILTYDINKPVALTYNINNELLVVTEDGHLVTIGAETASREITSYPLDIKTIDDEIWITHYKSDKVTVITPTDQFTINLGKSPWSLAYNDTHVFVSLSSSNKIAKINRVTYAVESSKTVSSIPFNLTTLPTSELAISYVGQSRVDIYDESLSELITTQESGVGPVTGVATFNNQVSFVTMYSDIRSRTKSIPPYFMFTNKDVELKRGFQHTVQGTISTTQVVPIIPTSEYVTITPAKSPLVSGDQFTFKITDNQSNYRESNTYPLLSSGEYQSVKITLEPRTTPNDFVFDPINNAIKNVDYDSNEITISGIAAGYTGTLECLTAVIIKNGTPIYTPTISISNGDKIKIRAKGLGSYGSVTAHIVKAGDFTTYFRLVLLEPQGIIQGSEWTKWYTGPNLTYKIRVKNRSRVKITGSKPKEFTPNPKLISGSKATHKNTSAYVVSKSLPKVEISLPTVAKLSDALVFEHPTRLIDGLDTVRSEVIRLNASTNVWTVETPRSEVEVNPVLIKKAPAPSRILDMIIEDPAEVKLQPRPASSRIILTPQVSENSSSEIRGFRPSIVLPNATDKTSSQRFEPQPVQIITKNKSFSTPIALRHEKLNDGVYKQGNPKVIKSTNKGFKVQFKKSATTKINYIKTATPKLVKLKPLKVAVKSTAKTPVKIKLNYIKVAKPKLAVVMTKSVTTRVIRNTDKDRFTTIKDCSVIGAFASRELAISECISKGHPECETFEVANHPCFMWYNPKFFGKVSVPLAWYLSGG